MNKTFTHRFIYYFQRLLPAILIVFFSAFIQPDMASTSTTGTGILAKTVKCYPNPAISFVNFEFPSDYIAKNYSIQIFSFTGKKMYESNITSAKISLTFSNEFYRGIYVYQLQDKNGKILETGKFQVTR